MADIKENVIRAKSASITLSAVSTRTKNKALTAMADALNEFRNLVTDANAKDMKAAETLKKKGELTDAMVKRLKADDEKIDGMIEGIRSVKKLKDPVGETMSSMLLDDGLTLYQIRCPIGLIGVIFESRPDVVPQIMSLCLKSGNAVALKGGAEASRTNRALFDILSKAAYAEGIPKGSFCLMETREDVSEILKLDDQIDLLIPRGSNEFVKYIQNNTKIPVLGHSAGICHVYVDADADIETALNVSLDSKIQYPAVCNAAENLLVHKKVAKEFIPLMVKMFTDNNVEVRVDAATAKFVGKSGKTVKAKAEDWDTEYNDMIISIKTVNTLDDAIAFINEHGSKHTDTIITANTKNAKKFAGLVDSSSVMINASTRFSDGFRYGKGAEVGISTNKIHSRGPVGMEGLTIYKYILSGNGHVVKDYSGRDAKKYKHTALEKDMEL